MAVPDATDVTGGEIMDPVTEDFVDQQVVAERLLAQAKQQGVSLVGPDELLNQLVKNVLKTALDAEMTEHLGHAHGGCPYLFCQVLGGLFGGACFVVGAVSDHCVDDCEAAVCYGDDGLVVAFACESFFVVVAP